VIFILVFMRRQKELLAFGPAVLCENFI